MKVLTPWEPAVCPLIFSTVQGCKLQLLGARKKKKYFFSFVGFTKVEDNLNKV